MFNLEGLKVCFVAGTLGQGGAERQLFYVVKALVESGALPRVLCLTRGEFWEKRIRDLGVPVAWVGERESRVARLGAIIKAAWKDRPDLLQSQHFYTNLYAVGAARALGIREVGAIRSNGIWERTTVNSVLARWSLRSPAVLAVNSQAAIRNIVAAGVPPGRLRFLPNVVDTRHFFPGDEPPNGRIRLLAVGKRTRAKRFDRLLSVLAAVQRTSTRPITAVLVTTGGADRDVLERQAADLGLRDGLVEFREAVADMAPLYRTSDIFLLTSDWEGTPNVVLEAMASGTPVVATRVGGVPDIVRHGDTGYLADPSDEAGFVQSVVTLVEDDGARAAMGQRARRYIDDTHSTNRLPAVLRAFYETVSA